MNYQEWLGNATYAVQDEIIASYAATRRGGWTENYITTRVLGAIEGVGTQMNWDDLAQHVVWEGYKLTGKAETAFGDIAILVRIQLRSDRFIEGVAFYEAKRQYFDIHGNPDGFKAATNEQFVRIAKASNASNVLLYDIDPSRKVACATSVPTSFMKALADTAYTEGDGRVLHYYGQNWLHFLGENLKGFGLDFSAKTVQSIKALAGTAGAPFAIMNVAIGKNELQPVLNPYFSTLPNYEKTWGIAPPSNKNDEGGDKIVTPSNKM